MTHYIQSALKLHQYLVQTHWNGSTLIGPDGAERGRFGRIAKSTLKFINWHDDHANIQAAGYWVASNWKLYQYLGNSQHRHIALQASEYILARQSPDGGWESTAPDTEGEISAESGLAAALGLLASYRATHEPQFLAGALRWHDYLINVIGFQSVSDELAINAIAHVDGARVCHLNALVLRFFAELGQVMGHDRYLKPAGALVRFLKNAQMKTGEIPYSVAGVNVPHCHEHRQCFYYNALQVHNLLAYYQASGDDTVLPIVRKALHFLTTGVANDGHTHYDCTSPDRQIVHHAAVLGCAFAHATQLGLADYSIWTRRCLGYLLWQQRLDGSCPYSQGYSGFLRDQRAYPRQQAIILYHLLQAEPYQFPLWLGADASQAVAYEW